MKIGYKRFLSFLINGVYRGYRDNLIGIHNEVEVLLFDFHEYVTSQMHLSILCNKYPERSLGVIHRVYKYLAGITADVEQDELFSVLSWFYYDMSKVLRSYALTGDINRLNLAISVSLPLESVALSFDLEKEQVLTAIEKGHSEYSRYIGLQYKELRVFEKLFLTPLDLDRFLMSIILSKFSATQKGKILKIGGVVPCD